MPTPSTSTQPILRYRDGRTLDAPPTAPADIIGLVDCQVLTNDTNIQSQIAYSPLLLGDDVVDAWQGLYWLMANADLLDCVPITEVRTNAPVVSVGSGPSLDDCLDELREKQDRLCIVAGHSTLAKLEEAGIEADFFAPIERVDFRYMMPTSPTTAAFAGLPVVPHEHRRCEKRYAVGNFDHLYRWAGMERAMILTGLTTGVASTGVACCISEKDSPVYLVGHDLASGHYAGYKYGGDAPDEKLLLECYDGEKRGSCMTWITVKDMLAQWAGTFPIKSACKRGAKIPGVEYAPLPAGVDKVEIKDTGKGLNAGARVRDYRSGIVGFLDSCNAGVQKAQTMNDINMTNMADERWHDLIMYLFRCYFVQFSACRRMGLTTEDNLLKWAKEAFANMHEGLRGSALELSRAA